MIATIAKENIRKIAVYVNASKMTMAQVKKALGCQYILNAGLYDMGAFKPINYLTVDGKVLSASGNPFGYAINGSKMVFSYGNNVKYPTFLGAYPVLVKDGKLTGAEAPVGLAGYRDRSAVGLKADGSVVLYCTQNNRSLNGIAGDLQAAGCVNAINLDGGGSSQGDFDGELLTSDRIVHNYLCIWTHQAEEKQEDKMKILLISGHGAGDPGAVAAFDGKTYREADETRKVTAALAKALAGMADVTVYAGDRNAYEDYKKGTLQAIAQFSKYDYVLEVHFNAIRKDTGDNRTKGVECYVTTSEAGTGVEEAICRRIAALGLTNRGVKRYNWAVINAAKKAGVSSALLEVCFLDDADDMKIYTAKYDKIVEAIADGIKHGFNLTDSTELYKRILRERAGLADKTIAYLEAYEYGADLLKKLAAAMQ